MAAREPLTIGAEIARTKRHNPNADVTELRREAHEAYLTRTVRKLAETFPPLTDDQRERIGLLLKGGRNDA